ncbi:hypothetical protein [Sporichthya polymorpha]|uniref:hypothetical protein n=1 Tax=Sporichthya polymorpha TaxID=35751 RepID=UPI00037F2EDF|nr:hypothetical protein [Sporichthya polymorpha]
MTTLDNAPALGDLGFPTAVSCYAPNLDMHRPTARPFGLTEQSMYLYGGWRDETGALHIVERKFCGPMTGGLWLMNTKSGKVTLAPESLNTVRGEVKREYSDSEHHLHGSLLGKAGGAPEEGLDYRLTPGAMHWREGTVMELSGNLVGPGIQIGSLDHELPFFYTSELYKISGTVLGEQVDGFVFLDHGYWPHGADWKEWHIFNRQQLSWTAWAAEFENGDVEWGQVCFGRDGFNFVAVANADGPVVLDATCRPGIDPDPDDWAARLGYQATDGRTWIFELEPGGQMSPFTAARWGGYRAQAGRVLRHGEDRPVKVAFGWGETFMERIRDAGVSPVDALLT